VSASKDQEDLPIFVKWQAFMEWLAPTVDRFPKKFRFTYANRLVNLGLDTVEDLVEARYTRNKRNILKRCNLRLEKMRVLLRLCHAQQFLSHGAYERAMRDLNEVGGMLGGWMRSQGA